VPQRNEISKYHIEANARIGIRKKDTRKVETVLQLYGSVVKLIAHLWQRQQDFCAFKTKENSRRPEAGWVGE
jgi:hypothetical protein